MSAASRSRGTDRLSLKRAGDLHRAGRLEDAATAYLALLKRNSRDWQASYLLGLLRNQQGQSEQAIDRIEAALLLNPELAEGWYQLGETQFRLERWDVARRSLERAVALNAGAPHCRFRLGLLAEREKRWPDAVQWYREVLRLQPDAAEAMNNLGHALANLGEDAEAEALYRQACAARADFAEPRVNLGLMLDLLGDADAALAIYEDGLAGNPDHPELNALSAVLFAARGDTTTAVERYGRALAADAGHGPSWNNLGVIYLEQGFEPEARACFERARDAQPELADAWSNLGNSQLRSGETAQARTSFERALQLRPDFAEAHNGLGTTLCEQSDLPGAQIAYERALEIKPALAETAANLAAVHQRRGALAEADRWYARALVLQPSVALRIRRATALRPIMGTEAEIAADRVRLAAGLAELDEDTTQASEDELLKYPDTMFYIAFHGENNRALLSQLATVYRRACPSLAYRSPLLDRKPRGRRVRVAFVSQHFFGHSVGYSFVELMRGLAADPRIEVAAVSLGHRSDSLTDRIRESCCAWVDARGNLPQLRAAVESVEPDVIVYTDIGMDPRTYLLAHARLARVQCVSGGHPETTGLASVDHFISSRWLEEPSAQDRYTEGLVRLDAYNTVIAAPSVPDHLPARDTLGWPSGRRVYLCPVKLQKLHPRFDRLLGSILRADPAGVVVLFEDLNYDFWRTQTEQRMETTMPDVRERVVFVPWAEPATLNAALLHADAVLDPAPFGLGTTAFIAFRMGVPIVTLPSEGIAGRGVRSCLARMELPWGIAASADEFVTKALALAQAPEHRRMLSKDILARADTLFGDTTCVRDLTDFFVSRTEQETTR